MFWDGQNWVPEAPRATVRRTPRRLRDWLATIPILLLVPALLVPYFAVDAATPSLTVTGVPTPGAQLRVAGTGLPSRSTLAVMWDGSTAGMPTARTSAAGTLAVTLWVPAGATAGQHVISVGSAKKGQTSTAKNALSRTTTVLVTAAVTVTPEPVAPPEPTVGPTLAPTANPTLAPTADPTLAPTANPTLAPTANPTLAPIANPTAAPTVAPTSTPAVTPDPGPVVRFEDSFSGSALGSAWKALYGPGDPGDRLDTDCMGDLRQVTVGGGVATIHVERKSTPSGRPFAGACIATYGTFGQRYGTWTARFRYDEAKGTWPSLFLLPVGKKGPYPEIDILEAYGDDACAGPGLVVQGVHYVSGAPSDYKVASVSNSDGWHTHTIVWTASRLEYYIDGALTHRVTDATHVPQVAMYPIFVFGVGANNPSCRASSATPDSLTMQIDYLRILAP